MKKAAINDNIDPENEIVPMVPNFFTSLGKFLRLYIIDNYTPQI